MPFAYIYFIIIQGEKVVKNLALLVGTDGGDGMPKRNCRGVFGSSEFLISGNRPSDSCCLWSLNLD